MTEFTCNCGRALPADHICTVCGAMAQDRSPQPPPQDTEPQGSVEVEAKEQ